MNTKILKWKESKTLSVRRAAAKKFFDKGDLASAVSILYSENEILTGDERAIAFSDIARYFKEKGLGKEAIRFWEYYLKEKDGKDVDPTVYDELLDCCMLSCNAGADRYYALLRGIYPDTSEEAVDKYVQKRNAARKEKMDDVKKALDGLGVEAKGIGKLFGIRETVESVSDNDEEEFIVSDNRSEFEQKLDEIAGKEDSFFFERMIAGTHMAGKDYNTASIFYAKIPSEYRTIEDDDAFAAANIVRGEYGYAIKICEESIRKTGYNVYACCNLYFIYKILEDEKKAAFYYEKAIANECSVDEYTKLIMCSVEAGDYATSLKAYKAISDKSPLNAEKKFLYGIAALNAGKPETAYKVFCEAYKIAPDDEVIKWYMEETDRLLSKEKNDVKLPLNFEKALPRKVLIEYDKTFSKIINGESVRISQKKLIEKACLTAFSDVNEYHAKVAAAVYAYCDKELAVKALKELLTSEFCSDIVKFGIIELFARENEERTVGLALNGKFMKIRFPSFPFDKEDKVGRLLLRSYADIIKGLVEQNITHYGKAEKTINELYENHYDLLEKTTLNNLELAAVIVYLSKFKEFECDEERLFSTYYTEAKKIKKFAKKIEDAKKC